MSVSDSDNSDSTSSANPAAKLWGGRFEQATDPLVEAFSASVHFDSRLYAHDIAGSIAHATMLAQIGVLSDAERAAIESGLVAIRADIEAGEFSWQMKLEDVHMNIEAELTRRIGDAGKKLHTGRSRNDQIATDIRLYLRDKLDELLVGLQRLCARLVDLAEREADTIMPGFTHLQPAQPVTFGHHMLAWTEMLLRDIERFIDCRKRLNRMPLGAAALAGTSYPIDREQTRQLLGFESVCHNSLDAVSDRDFAIEFVADCSMLAVHLSRFSEELVIWSTSQFGFVTMGDAFCTGSSIMPQKKNPDVPELVRGKCSRVIGHLNSLLVLMKGQPLAYNRDNQEDKEPLFDCIDTIEQCVAVYAALVPSLTVNRERTRESARLGFTTATDLADYLVRKNIAFRDAHEIVGRAVSKAIELGVDLSELDLSVLKTFSSAIDEDVYEVLTLEGSVAARAHSGGTAPDAVRASVKLARQRLQTLTKEPAP